MYPCWASNTFSQAQLEVGVVRQLQSHRPAGVAFVKLLSYSLPLDQFSFLRVSSEESEIHRAHVSGQGSTGERKLHVIQGQQ